MLDAITLTANDGVSIAASLCVPSSQTNSCGVVLVQEIFGVNAHIRYLVNDFAERGFTTIAPHFFDRVSANVALDYSPESFTRGRQIVGELGFDAPMRDVRAAANYLLALGVKRVAVIGYCWGGVIATLAATRLGIAGVGYYGGRIAQFLHERPQAPLLLHFGAHDAGIPATTVDTIAAAWPQLPLHRYLAGHAFNRVGHADYHAESATLALARTLSFLEQI
jgi:carboxymethylenebutenolidase